MGNCVETCTQTQGQQDEDQMQQQKQHHDEQEDEIRFVEESNLGKDRSIRVKIVLTKEELEWLMLQLKERGGKSLEDVLEEIQRSRAKVEGWKPSLESIMECPEVNEMDR